MQFLRDYFHMKLDILHRTRYVYSSPVRDSFNDVRLEPPSVPEQTVESFLLKVLPAVRLKHYTDFYGNWIHHFEIPEPHSYLLIESQSRDHHASGRRPFPRMRSCVRWPKSARRRTSNAALIFSRPAVSSNWKPTPGGSRWMRPKI